MASKQRKVANDFATTFPLDTIKRWKRMVKKWEANPSRPNPYVSKDRGRLFCFIQVPRLTVFLPASKVSEIRLRLAQEEAAEAERGQRAPHQITASVFIRMGLELEDQQWVFILQLLFLRSKV
jgi:hypothetical protein